MATTVLAKVKRYMPVSKTNPIIRVGNKSGHSLILNAMAHKLLTQYNETVVVIEETVSGYSLRPMKAMSSALIIGPESGAPRFNNKALCDKLERGTAYRCRWDDVEEVLYIEGKMDAYVHKDRKAKEAPPREHRAEGGYK